MAEMNLWKYIVISSFQLNWLSTDKSVSYINMIHNND